MPGLFITLEGIDGTGKSTQGRLLADWLRGRGHSVTTCVEPGGTPLGDVCRELLLGRKYDMTLTCEVFLFMASRAELVAQVIRPALLNDGIVICDRFLLSSVVYQGHAGGLPSDEIWRIGRTATGGLEPDLTFVFDMPVSAALARRNRPADRIESRDGGYHERVRAGFLAEAKRNPDRIIVLDSQSDIESIQSQVQDAVKYRLRGEDRQ